MIVCMFNPNSHIISVNLRIESVSPRPNHATLSDPYRQGLCETVGHDRAEPRLRYFGDESSDQELIWDFLCLLQEMSLFQNSASADVKSC